MKADPDRDETAKNPDQKFWMDCKKDKIGNFERGYSQSNHRKVTDFGLLQDFKRMIMTFGSRVDRLCSDPSASMKIFCCILLAVSLIFLLTGCEFFMTPQERSGVNPKPFNSQAGWEYTYYGSFRN